MPAEVNQNNKHKNELDQFADQAILDELLQLDQNDKFIQSGGSRRSKAMNLDLKESNAISRSSPSFNHDKTKKKVNLQE